MSLNFFPTLLGLLLTLASPRPAAVSRPPITGPRSMPALHSRAEFDALARVTETPEALPHLLFVIDRKAGNRIYYVNSKRYRFHQEFIHGEYLSLQQGQKFFADNYLDPNRRFILGTLAYQAPIQRWTFEFWEGDLIPSALIRLASEVVNRSFFAPVAFKPNSLRQEQAAAALTGVQRVLESEIEGAREYRPLHLARGIGRLRILDRIDASVAVAPDEILVLPETPVHLLPVAGLITTRPSTPLSHINLLAGSWGIPNASIRDAERLFRPHDGEWVFFETRRTTYTLRPARPEELEAYRQRQTARRQAMAPRADLSARRLADLRGQRAPARITCGAKSANLGEVLHARLPGIRVPPGFTVPFFYYDQFLRQNHLRDAIAVTRREPRFARDALYRRQRLEALRERIQAGSVDPQVRSTLLRRAHARLPGKGLFLRSSTNSEDLPNFSGAGLYTTVPNVRGDDATVAALKTVWASVWNFEAYEARERAGIDHDRVFMAVLVQEGIDADSAGVMITTDPYDPENRDSIYISAKRGLGIKVVEGQKVAEQLLFTPRSNAVRLLTRSEEDSRLIFDARGGIKEVPITGERAVLTDDLVRRLARAATGIRRLFGGRDEDIEWVIRGGQIYIVQARPYVRSTD
jgi:hypothetical protein